MNAEEKFNVIIFRIEETASEALGLNASETAKERTGNLA